MTTYYRKWTRMAWWESVRYFHKYGLFEYKPEHRMMHLFAPVLNNREFAKQNDKTEDELDNKLISKLYRQYPDLKYEISSQNRNDNSSSSNYNYATRFILKQKELMQQGFSEQASFEKVEALFLERMKKRTQNSQISHQLAVTNEARSFLTFYQQQAEFEARLKVMRMKRDLINYERAQEKLQSEIFNKQEQSISNDEETFGSNESEGLYNSADNHQNSQEDVLNKVSEKKAQSDRYERVLYAIKTKNISKAEGIEKEKQRKNRTQIANEFIQRTKNMFNLYYTQAAISDRLEGLADEDIKFKISESPSKIQNHYKQLLKRLDNLKVTLQENGEVDFSSVKIENIRKELENNPEIKIALMLKDLDFEFPHKEHMIDESMKYRSRLRQLEFTDKEEIRDQAFIQILNENKPKDDIIPIDPEILKKIEIELQRNFESEQQKPLYKLKSTYQVFETYEQRLARIEEKWLKKRLLELEYDITKSEADVIQEKNESLKNVVEKLRRLKFRIDQVAMENAEARIFEEHDVFTNEQMMIDSDIPFEDLEEYLHRDKQQNDFSQNQRNYTNILKLIERRDVEEDLIEPFTDDYRSKLYNSDSLEELRAQELSRKLRLKRRILSVKNQEQNEQDQEEKVQIGAVSAFTKGVLVDPLSQGGETRAQQKQLLEFINRANKQLQVQKNSGKGKQTDVKVEEVVKQANPLLAAQSRDELRGIMKQEKEEQDKKEAMEKAKGGQQK